ncbi:MAG: hypothetical protein HS126_22105 [Anaerolineales bacterium]|nr:hypothetical protein [Anaerolineales bacterium]
MRRPVFGAGRFGIIGRGHAGIQWDLLFYQDQAGHVTGREKVPQYDNYVDFGMSTSAMGSKTSRSKKPSSATPGRALPHGF